jgi:hypothetical protein
MNDNITIERNNTMSVYIQNMDIPNNCAECPIKSFDGEDDVCPFSGVSVLNIGRQASCPLVEAGSKLRQVVLCKECIHHAIKF